MTELSDLIRLTKIEKLYYIQNHIIPEITKRKIQTVPDTNAIQQEIYVLKQYLDNKYLNNID